MEQAIPLVQDALYYVVQTTPPAGATDVHLPPPTATTAFASLGRFASAYAPYHLDFGPANLAWLKRAVDHLDDASDAAGDASRLFVVLNGADRRQLANSITLLALYLVIRFGVPAADAVAFFGTVAHRVPPFHDASEYEDPFGLTVLDVVAGYAAAAERGWIDLDGFDAAAFEEMETLEAGDRTWLIPGCIAAMSSPGSPHSGLSLPECARSLVAMGVTALVQLNEDLPYDPGAFERRGVEHVRLVYPDGDVPPDDIVDAFLTLMSKPGRVAAVHCKAGLGRTGTLAGMWMIAEFGLTAREAIGWMRLCRPGCVIGPQQEFLERFARIVRGEEASPPRPQPRVSCDRHPDAHTASQEVSEGEAAAHEAHLGAERPLAARDGPKASPPRFITIRTPAGPVGPPAAAAYGGSTQPRPREPAGGTAVSMSMGPPKRASISNPAVFDRALTVSRQPTTTTAKRPDAPAAVDREGVQLYLVPSKPASRYSTHGAEHGRQQLLPARVPTLACSSSLALAASSITRDAPYVLVDRDPHRRAIPRPPAPAGEDPYTDVSVPGSPDLPRWRRGASGPAWGGETVEAPRPAPLTVRRTPL